jgi:hypothetical protein
MIETNVLRSETNGQAGAPQGETQETIGTWAKETFPGGDDLSPRHAIRLLEEVVELCLAAGARPHAIRGAALGVLGHREDHRSYAESPDKVAFEIADVEIVLRVLAHRRGVNLQAYVDRKMQVNRSRRWKANGDGTGYHVKDGAA